MTETFPELAEQNEAIAFKPNRTDGLKRLQQFASRTGRHYAGTRNYDYGALRRSNVSALSPWVRHRLVTEEDILSRVLAAHSLGAADKFVQEVFWRTYFKGWLEQRPSVWVSYQHDLLDALNRLEQHPDLRANYKDAVSGRTGIDCFDHWVRELETTGYLHNHARMWFASIWIFTLRLPWQLGADFFLRHLLDGHPASNTLSWRWVAGLHTKGKTYLARPDNIAKYTEGRFQPKGLAYAAEPLVEHTEHPCVPISVAPNAVEGPYLLLVTEDDLGGTDLMSGRPAQAIGLLATHGRSPTPVGQAAENFAHGAMASVLRPYEQVAQLVDDWADPLIEAARQCGVKTIATAFAPIGPVRARLDRAEPKMAKSGINLVRIMRRYDRIAWPHAKVGFFGLKKQIPTILRQLDLMPDPS